MKEWECFRVTNWFKGTLEYACGALYTGSWHDDLPNGYGQMNFSDSTSYKGSWSNGLRHGKGTYIYQNGDIYEGEWNMDVRNGKGKMSYTDQTDYEGTWSNGLVCTNEQLNCIMLNLCQYHGHGIIRSPRIAFEGEFVNGTKDGTGVMRYESGVEYKGSWKKDLYHGNGTITYKRGMIRSYMGEWQNGKRHGTGILQMFNDDVFDGHFRDNYVSKTPSPVIIESLTEAQMHGSGTYTWKNGTALKSKWNKGIVQPNTECVLSIPSKANPTKKKQIPGTYLDGRVVSTKYPPLHIPQLPSLDLLQ